MHAHTPPVPTTSTSPPETAERVGARLLADFNAALLGALIAIGDHNGLFMALVDTGPVTPDGLAHHTGQSSRYLAEWLAALACAGYVECDAATETFWLPPAVAVWLVPGGARSDTASKAGQGVFSSPLQAPTRNAEPRTQNAEPLAPSERGTQNAELITGLFALLAPLYGNASNVADAFHWGTGVPHRAFGEDFHLAFEQFSGALFARHLIQGWVAAIDGLDAKLRSGGRVADVGCGCGGALVSLAMAYPDVALVGYDCSSVAVTHARAEVAALGLDTRLRFEERDATEGLDGPFDLISAYFTIHAMVDPQGALLAMREALAPDGVVLLIELDAPNGLERAVGHDRGLGLLTYGMSVLYGLTVSLADGGSGLGALDGARAEMLARRAGFTCFRRLPATHPLAVVYELRP